jgi:hypothetical protein
MANGFLDLPLELRQKIYFELLVCTAPIAFEPDEGGTGTPHAGPPKSRRLSRRTRHGLSPAILRVNWRIYREASKILYTQNRFEIPYAIPDPMYPENNQVALFLTQIRDQARLIRHICVDFPHWDFNHPDETTFHREWIQDLGIVRSSCQDVKVLELSLHMGYNRVLDEPVSPETLGLMDRTVRDVLSPTEIRVHVQTYDEDDIRDNVNNMSACGWVVEVTKRESVESVELEEEETDDSVDDDDGVEFDENGGEFMKYVSMLEKEGERKEWLARYWGGTNGMDYEWTSDLVRL